MTYGFVEIDLELVLSFVTAVEFRATGRAPGFGVEILVPALPIQA